MKIVVIGGSGLIGKKLKYRRRDGAREHPHRNAIRSRDRPGRASVVEAVNTQWKEPVKLRSSGLTG